MLIVVSTSAKFIGRADCGATCVVFIGSADCGATVTGVVCIGSADCEWRISSNTLILDFSFTYLFLDTHNNVVIYTMCFKL